jgi:hypothetical protein
MEIVFIIDIYIHINLSLYAIVKYKMIFIVIVKLGHLNDWLFTVLRRTRESSTCMETSPMSDKGCDI